MQRSLSTPSHNMNRPTSRNVNQTPIFQRRRSYSTSGNCTIEKKHGFKPSDRFDPVKREFLVQLGRKFWCRPVRIFTSFTLNSSNILLNLSYYPFWLIKCHDMREWAIYSHEYYDSRQTKHCKYNSHRPMNINLWLAKEKWKKKIIVLCFEKIR